MTSLRDSLKEDSVCPPQEKQNTSQPPRRIYVAKCPGCGKGPYRRIEGGGYTCSTQCERNYNRIKANSVRPEPKKLSKKQRLKLRRREAAMQWAALNKTPAPSKVKNITDQYSNDPQPVPKPKRKLRKRAKYLKEKFGDSFYTTVRWVELRYEVLKRDGRQCRVCGNGPKDGAKIHVDHIKPRSKFPELQFDINNLQVLCRDCNIGKNNKDEIDWRDK